MLRQRGCSACGTQDGRRLFTRRAVSHAVQRPECRHRKPVPVSRNDDVFIGLIVLVQTLMRGYDEAIIRPWWGSLGYVGLVWLGYYVVQGILFARTSWPDRAQARTSFHDITRAWRRGRSAGSLALPASDGAGVGGLGVWMVVERQRAGYRLGDDRVLRVHEPPPRRTLWPRSLVMARQRQWTRRFIRSASHRRPGPLAGPSA